MPPGASLGAAAECLSAHSKCPLPLWLDALSHPESGDEGQADGAKPWTVDGATAAERVRDLSPMLVTRSVPIKGLAAATVDVHEKMRTLVSAATSRENLWGLPSAFQSWL